MSKNKYVPSASQTREVNEQREAVQPDESAPTERKRRSLFNAGNCPKSDRHGLGRVYRTLNRIRYCVCDQCGHTWTKAGPPASENNSHE